MGFEQIDVAGDAGIKATGGNLKELFENAILGMYSLIVPAGKVMEKKAVRVEKSNSTPEALLVGVLNELIFHFDAYGFVGCRADISETGKKNDGFYFRGAVYGEDFDPSRHESGLLLKAATYHDLKVTSTDGLWEAEVIFDI
jgi:SHS2 domain-containing protein